MTPTDQELEKVAREAVIKLNPSSDGERVTQFNIILSALKQVQPTKERPYNSELADVMLNEGDYEGLAHEVSRPSPQKPLVDSIAVSPQEQISATPQNDVADGPSQPAAPKGGPPSLETAMNGSLSDVVAFMKESGAGIFKIVPTLRDGTIKGAVIFLDAEEAQEILPIIEEIERKWEDEN